MITEEEKEQRREAVQFAIDNNRLEGLDVNNEMLSYFQKWINDEITLNELKTKAYEI
ncbi:antitoxin VbhA family protein [Gallibacterium salpingitidis]|uniref:antitoxin VbhA family protein n=1 Tax=Gallibacterium salpingitidis TaxID=505341 RepID=UPI000A9ABC51|nr:antitoxin VbhA family protein [Gallibacterium salpingitidis]